MRNKGHIIAVVNTGPWKLA